MRIEVINNNLLAKSDEHFKRRGRSFIVITFSVRSLYANVYIYATLSWRVRGDTISVFKQTASLKLEFSVSKTGCLIKAQEPNLLYYLPLVGGE